MAYEYEDQKPNQAAPAGSAPALGIARGGQVAAERGQAMLDAAARAPAPATGFTPDPSAVAAARIIEKGKQQPQGYVPPPARAGTGFNPGAALASAGQALSTVNDMASDSMAARFPNATRVINQARTDIAAAPSGAATAGQVVRGVLAAPVGFAADVVDKARSVVDPVINAVGTAVTGNNTPIVGVGAPAAAPAAAAPAPATAVAPAATAVAPAAAAAPAPVAPATAGTPSGTTANTQPQVQTSAVAGAPGVTKTVDASGRTTYSNVATGFQPGAISPQNEAAATALDARYRAEGAAAAAAGNPAPGSQMAVIPYTPPERMVPTVDTRGLSVRQRVGFAQQEAERAQRGQIAAQGFDVQREGQAIQARGQDLQASQAGARLGFDREQATRTGALTSAQTGEVRQRVQMQQDVLNARSAYDAALQGGDKKAIAAAEKKLRAAQGKWEKEDNFAVTPISAGIDPTTGQPRGAGAVILNRETGDARFVSPAEAQGGAQQGGQQQQFVQGKVYVDGQGRKATWDGNKFVPVPTK